MSNRKILLSAIAKLGTATMDELDTNCDLSREKIRFTLGDVKKAGLAKTVRDDVTGGPAYKLTAEGEKWLKEQKQQSSEQHPKPVEGKITGSAASDHPHVAISAEGCAEAPAATCKQPLQVAPAADETPCCNAAKVMATTAQEVTGELRADLKLAQDRIDGLQDEAERRGQTLEGIATFVADYLPPAPTYTTLDGVAMMDQLITVQRAELINERLACRLMHDQVQALESQLAALRSDNEALRATRPATTAPYYAVARPKKPMKRFAKHTSAKAAALAAARSDGLAEVFALLPMGKAVRGAEWKDAA